MDVARDPTAGQVDGGTFAKEKDRSYVKRRISALIKSGLSKGLKWGVSDTHYCLKLPVEPETKEAIDFLLRVRTSAAVYMHQSRSGPIAYQWRLSYHENGSIWRAGARLLS